MTKFLVFGTTYSTKLKRKEKLGNELTRKEIGVDTMAEELLKDERQKDWNDSRKMLLGFL